MKIKCTQYKQNGKNFVHINDVDNYFENLEQTYKYIEKGANVEFLYFAFVSLCSSTLEASLNYILFTYFLDEYGPIDYKKYSDSMIKIGFKNKLHITPTIVTKSKFCFNSDSFTIKTLEEMITLRNRILHKTPILQETELDLHTDLEVGMNISLKSHNHVKMIDKKKCENFNKAMINFKNEFMIPFDEKRLKKTDLVIG